jgi:hypothetical protein
MIYYCLTQQQQQQKLPSHMTAELLYKIKIFTTDANGNTHQKNEQASQESLASLFLCSRELVLPGSARGRMR